LLIAMGIFLISSIFEMRTLFIQWERKEAVIYICIAALALGLSVYLMLTPKFYSFAHMMNELFNVQ